MPSLAKALALGLLIALLGIAVSLLPQTLAVETSMGLDWLFRLRGPRPAPPQVVVISIDRESARHLRLPTDPKQWPRALHAQLIHRLAAAGARVIVFDIAFEEPQNSLHDGQLAEAIQKAGNVILFERLLKDTRRIGRGPNLQIDVEQRRPLIPALAHAALATAPFVLPKVPLRVSECWFFKDSAGDTPTLPMVAFLAYTQPFHQDLLRLLQDAERAQRSLPPHGLVPLRSNRDIDQMGRRLHSWLSADPTLARHLLSRLEHDRRLTSPLTRRLLTSLITRYSSQQGGYLDFYGPPRTITTLPYHRVLAADRTGPMTDAGLELSGKAVFVGFAEQFQPEQKDGFYTVFSRLDGVDVSGVEIAATAFANLLEGRSVKPVTGVTQLTLIGLFGLTAGVLLSLLPPPAMIPGAVAIASAYLMAAYGAFVQDGTWLPLLVPLLLQLPVTLVGALLWRSVTARREQQRTHKTLGYYVPTGALATLIRDGERPASCQHLVYGACLATDAEQYTRLSETLSPDSLRKLLNRYYQQLFEPVQRRGGFVSDVVGDAMLAIWTGTKPARDLRKGACLAALDIQKHLERFRLRAREGALLTRMGLHAGNLVLGNVGAGDHYEYRAVGDIVNVAHRLEELNKVLGTRVLASAEMVRGLDGLVTREIGCFRLAGKRRPLVIHEVMGAAGDRSLDQEVLCARFAVALETFRTQSLAQALNTFQWLLRLYPTDGPSHYYLRICRGLQQAPASLLGGGIIELAKYPSADRVAGSEDVTRLPSQKHGQRARG